MPFNFLGWPTNAAGMADADDGAFHAVSTLQAVSSGEHWITPFGIPFPHGTTGDGIARNAGSTQRTKMFARYPNNDSGTLYPIQTEQFKTRADGKQLHCTGHFKTPSGYVALEKIGIGFKTSESTPSTPDWATIVAAGDDFELQLTIKEPRLFYVATDVPPTAGDVVQIAITDTTGTLTYKRSYNFFDDFVSGAYSSNGWAILGKDITDGLSVEGAASRYRCYDVSPVNPKVGMQNSNRRDDVLWQNANAQPTSFVGLPFGLAYNKYRNLRPRTSTGTGGSRWPVYSGNFGGLYIWPRDNGGNPEDYTIAVTITRGLALAFDNVSTNFEATHALAYDGQTTNFVAGDTIFGANSWETAVVVGQTDSSSTAGTLYLKTVTGTFEDNEPLYIYGATTQYALVNGTLSQTVLTGAGGATGKICAITSNGSSGTIYLSETNGTAFVDNEAITSNGGGAALANGAGTRSTTSFYSNNGGTLATSGALTAVNNKVNGTVWSAVFDDATDTYDSPWFTGHQVRQVERTTPLMNGATPHDHLVARFLVTFDKDGVVVDREVWVENSKINSRAQDYWYDANVLVGGVSQTTGQSKYRLLYHHLWSSWRWRQSYTFGMCDPGDFMKARIIYNWYRQTSKDCLHDMAYKVKGGNVGGSFRTLKTDQYYWGGYVRTDWNEPLYTGGWDFGDSGGARPEIGPWTHLAWFFYANDSMTNWPAMEAAADNVVGALGINIRDESYTSDTEDYGGPPNAYTKHSVTDPWNNSTYKIGKPIDGYDALANFTVGHLYSLRDPTYNVKIDHAPAMACYEAYWTRPEKRFFDNQEHWSWIYAREHTAQAAHTPKASGVAGDSDHHLAWDEGNGARGWAWPAREWIRAAAIQFEGARRRTYWRRMATDMAGWYDQITSKTAFGMFVACFRSATGSYTSLAADRAKYNSDTWGASFTDLSAGKVIPSAMFGAGTFSNTDSTDRSRWTAGTGLSVDTLTINALTDPFKSLYCEEVKMHGLDVNAFDDTTGLTRCVWPGRSLWAAPQNDWKRAVGTQGICIFKNPTKAGRLYQFMCADTTNHETASDDSMQELKDFLATVGTSESAYDLWTNSSQPILEIKQFHVKTGPQDWTTGYSFEAMHMIGVHDGLRHSTDATYRALCESYIDLWDTEWPRSATTGITAAHNTQGVFNYADSLMCLDFIKDEDVTNW